MKNFINTGLLSFAVCFASTALAGDKDPGPWNVDKCGVVLNGFDVVAYHV